MEVEVSPLYHDAVLQVGVCPWKGTVEHTQVHETWGTPLPDPGIYCGWDIHGNKVFCEC